MEDFLLVKHTYNAGDLLTLLPGLQHIHNQSGRKSIIFQHLDFPAFYYEGAYSPVRDKEGQQVCMNKEMFDRLYPLIMSQPYIKDFRIWNGEKVEINIDLTRDSRVIPMPAGLIHYYAFSKFPELACDLSKKWIHFPPTDRGMAYKKKYSDKILINRTHRYTNPYISYHFLKEYEDRLLFIGTPGEHQSFCSQFDLQIKHDQVDNFQQLARAMKFCKGGLFNQSFCWHLADSIKIHRVLELCSGFPNTFPTGANGHAFYHQDALEYHFHQILNNEKQES